MSDVDANAIAVEAMAPLARWLDINEIII